MKFIVHAALFCALVFLQSVNSKFLPHSGQTIAFTCISNEHLLKYAEKIAIFMLQDKAPTDDVKFNKFMSCYWKSKGLLTATGDIDLDNLKKYLETIFANGGEITPHLKEIARNTVDYCQYVRGDSPGQNAVMVQNCITAYLMELE